MPTPQIDVYIGGKKVSREQVVAKEMVRAHRALRKLCAPPVSGSPELVRKALLERKLELGREQIKAMFAKETARSAIVPSALAATSFGRRRPSGIEITASGITGKAFVDWFHSVVDADNEAALLAAHPDHFAINNTAQGQEVYETLGGAPLVSAFTIDFSSPKGISIPTIDDLPYRIVGRAVLANGRAIGGAKHQFGDDGPNLRASLGIDFPLMIPPPIWHGHRWHLAIEFSNWIEAAAADIG